MDRWQVLRKQMPKQMPKPGPRSIVLPAPEPSAIEPGESPFAGRAWVRNLLWMLAGYFLLRLLEGGLRPGRPRQTI